MTRFGVVSTSQPRHKMIGLVILTILTVVIGTYLWLKKQYQFWENHRVPYLEPTSLIFGNNNDVVTGKLSLAENLLKIYEDLAPHKFGGIYIYYKPLLFVRDPELIKNILIKDFNHFSDRSFTLAHKQDPLSLHLFNLYGEEWKVLRQKLSPTFTSGKMKVLFGFMNECAQKLDKIIEESVLSHQAIDAKDLMARYATDVISSCAFGLEVDSLHNPNSEFRTMGKAVFASNLRQRLRDGLFSISPALVYFIRFTLFPKYLTNFFVNLVSDTIEHRIKNKIVRNDFLNLLMNVQKEEEKSKHFNFTMELLTAQCFVFFAAGFETSSNALSFILYELAAHLEVQQKLQKEVDHVLKQYNGQITYEMLQELHYMDKVFNETSRLFPAVPFLLRICTEDYRLPDSDYLMKRGQTLFIPIYGLHRDPQYFPDPDVFNPENFSEEAKASRPNCCFLPFGDGPRNCIGMRFGLMQVKLALTNIMREYTITISPQMKLPLQLQTLTPLVATKNEILLNFNKRIE